MKRIWDMKKSILEILFVGVFIIFFVSCSEDIGVRNYSYQCETDKECGEGYRCDKERGCIKVSKDGGVDTGIDVEDIRDISEDVMDVEDITDILDAGDIADADDIIVEDIADVSEDILDVEDGGDVEVTDISDGGVDGGVNYLLRMESVYDSNAGVCSSPNYILESITGFTASEEMRGSNYILHRNMLFKR